MVIEKKSIVRFPRSRRNVGCAGSDSSSRIITRTKEHGELLTVVEEKIFLTNTGKQNAGREYGRVVRPSVV